MSYVFDSSSIFYALKRRRVDVLAGNYTVSLARYELGNILWKEEVLHKRITSVELERLIGFLKRVLDKMKVLKIECCETEVLNIARSLEISFYDASYVFYARKIGVPLITEDLKLIQRAKPLVDTLTLNDIIGSF